MKRLALLLVVALPVCGQSNPMLRSFKPRVDACSTQTLACNDTTTGQLTGDDCTLDDGTLVDAFAFSGQMNQFVEVHLTPLDSTFTNAALLLEPPPGDAKLTPAMSYGAEVVLRYVLSSTGTWLIGVNTWDLAARGQYRLELRCGQTVPVDSRDCVQQFMTCGQRFDGEITATSCKFSGTTGRLYQPARIFVRSGDHIEATVSSNDFDPSIAIYRSSGGAPILNLAGRQFGPPADAIFNPTADDSYSFVASPIAANTAGSFVLKTFACSTTCNGPSIVTQPQGATIPYLSDFNVTAIVTGDDPLSFIWYRGVYPDTSSPYANLNSPSLLLRNVTADTTVWLLVKNNCATIHSETVTVHVNAPPPPPGHRRAVSH